MAIKIEDTGVSLRITIGTDEIDVIKSEIKRVKIIKGNIIKIDMGLDTLENVYLPYVDVVEPLTSTVKELRDNIVKMLNTNSGVTATEARQIEQIGVLNSIKDTLTSIDTHTSELDNKIFYEPLLIDDSGAGIVYKGYAAAGEVQSASRWAIERIENKGDVIVHSWADGNKNLDNVWNDRESLAYL